MMRVALAAAAVVSVLAGAAFAQQAPVAPSAPPPAAAPAAPPVAVAPAPPAPAVTAPTFAVGDVVRLKSGSPRMTVVEGGNSVLVLWHVEDQGFKQERIPAAALMMASDKDDEDE